MNITLHEGLRFIAKGKGRKVYRVLQVRSKSVVVLREDTDNTTVIPTVGPSAIINKIAEVL